MPNLIIDGLPLAVAAGTLVIDAAEQLGIMIPRFCYLKVLGRVGACRMCAVSFLAGPVQGVKMSCMIEAREGMVVSTTDPAALAFRRQVIEWLMINHPLDCPVCDEGGQCLLQDETISGGHGRRRFHGPKRTYRDQDLGPFIQQEMNRCIHCYRCVRFYQEYAGGRDFGTMQIANRIFYGRFADGPLASPFSGNLVDLCPTGVFTDKTARYKARFWDRQRAASLCLNCSLGCNTFAAGSYNALVCLEAREAEAVNGSFICDRGRFGGFYANHRQRPWRPLIDREESSWSPALAEAGARLGQIVKQHGSQAVAVLGSTRSSLETLGQLHHSQQRLGWRQPAAFADPALANKTTRALARLEAGSACSLGEIAQADFLLVVGADPVNEAPMLALALRQAARGGAAVVAIDPRPLSLPCAFTHLPVSLGELEALAALVVRLAVTPPALTEPEVRDFWSALPTSADIEPGLAAEAERLAPLLGASRQPVIICGTAIVATTTPDLAADLAQLLRQSLGKCGLFTLLSGANSYGAALLAGPEAPTVTDLVRGMEEGTIKALLAVEADPFHHFPDRRRLTDALAKLELLLVLEYLPTELANQAHILLPTANHFESAGHFVNQEGRLQFAEAVHPSRRPMAQRSGGGHPPRNYARDEETEGIAKPAAEIIQTLSQRLAPESEESVPHTLWALLAAAAPGRGPWSALPYPADHHRILTTRPPGATRFVTAGPTRENHAPATLQPILSEWTFGSEELSSYSDPIRQATQKPTITLHRDDLPPGFREAELVRLCLPQGSVAVTLALATSMARGIVVLPRHCHLDWQLLSADGSNSYCWLEKIE